MFNSNSNSKSIQREIKVADRTRVMKRSSVYGLSLGFMLIAWGLSMTALNPWVPEKYEDIVTILPWYALICFGSYTLLSIGLELLQFNDYPEEVKVLEGDIKNAKRDLKTRGFKGLA